VGPNDLYQATVVSMDTCKYLYVLTYVRIHIQMVPNDPYHTTVMSYVYISIY